MSKINKKQEVQQLPTEAYVKAIDSYAIVAQTDAKGIITFVNQKFCEISGYSEDELIGKDHRIVNSGYHDSSFFKSMWADISSGKTWRGEIKNQAKDGSIYWVDTTITPLIDSQGEVEGYISFRYEITDRKNNEQLYKESQKIGVIGGWEVNLEPMQLYWTDETYRIHEIEIGSELDVEKAINYYAEHEREKVGALVERCIVHGESFEDEFELLTAKGKSVWVHSKGQAEVDKNGKVIKIYGTFQDITQRKKLQNNLLMSKKRLDLALDGAGLGIWDWDLTTNDVSFDQRWAEMLGLDIDDIEMSLNTWESRVHPDDLEKCYADIKDYMDGKTDRYENIHRMKHTDGHWVYILDKGKFSGWDKFGNPTRFTGTHYDITESKEAEVKKLREFTEILSSTPSCLKIISKEGKLISMNKQGLDLIESPDFESVDHANVYDIVEESHREKFKEFNEKVCEGHSGTLIFEIIGLNGTRRWMETYASPYKFQDGSYGHIAITNEITEKIKAEEELEKQKAYAQHQAKLASIGELAAGVGHEINNPLAIISGYLQNIENTLGKNEELDINSILNQMGKMGVAVNRIASIVKGLRTFSRTNSESHSYFNVTDSIGESLDMLKEIYEKDGIQLDFNLAGFENIEMLGNRGKFQQIIMNLIANAKDATASNAQRKLKLNMEIEGNQVAINISDNGSGIPENVKNKIFDPFFTTKEVNQGTGIGLSLVNNFVNEMKGKISFETSSRGTTFSILFPFRRSSSIEPVVKSSTQLTSYNANVLVVDDEDGIREILKIHLNDLSCNVVCAENAHIALEYLANDPTKFDLIISDMKMPDIDGPDFLRKVRNNHALRQPKFVFFTGGVSYDFKDKNNELNNLIDGHFYKPFTKESIMEVLSKCLTDISKKAA
jgi:PAS domain S-box-containing protein